MEKSFLAVQELAETSADQRFEMDGHERGAPSIPVWKVLADGHHACVSQHLFPIKWLAEPELGNRRLESRAGIAASAALQAAA